LQRKGRRGRAVFSKAERRREKQFLRERKSGLSEGEEKRSL